MFDCHRAEITIMQFTGHSLPVHQSMIVPLDFTFSHIVSQARLRQWNMHFRCLWNGMFGGVEGQYTTTLLQSLNLKLASEHYLRATQRYHLLHEQTIKPREYKEKIKRK